MAQALKLKLSHEGYEVEVVADGNAALALMKERPFNLVLLDLMMPHCDGFGVLEDMKKRGDATPVIVLTNLSQREDEERVKQYGAKGFYVKADTPLTDIVNQVQSVA